MVVHLRKTGTESNYWKPNPLIMPTGNCLRALKCRVVLPARSASIKPWIIFSACYLSEEQKIAFAQAIEPQLYTCGSALFPPTSPYHSTIVVCRANSCTDPVVTQYYSAKLVIPAVCYYCGMSEETLVNDEEIQELKQQYVVVCPFFFFSQHKASTHTQATPIIWKRKKT